MEPLGIAETALGAGSFRQLHSDIKCELEDCDSKEKESEWEIDVDPSSFPQKSHGGTVSSDNFSNYRGTRSVGTKTSTGSGEERGERIGIEEAWKRGYVFDVGSGTFIPPS